MTTLIGVYNSEGCVGRCDARCYDAKHPDCDCICGGKNHGAGLNRAVENTRELASAWIEKARADGLDFTHAALGSAVDPTLF
ncbi:MAG: hypothetical protein LC798_12280 [Chloroflexi bacterium]|nr:hypothetical protein [Chloroflexota bacterium]